MNDVTTKRNRTKFTLIVIGGIVLLCVFLSVSGLGLRILRVAGPPIDGQEAFIRVDTPSAIVALDMVALQQAAAVRGETLLAMEADGRIFLVRNGTRVRVVYADARAYHVQIIDGESAGKQGYTPASFVQH
jgi:hypothetical protein